MKWLHMRVWLFKFAFHRELLAGLQHRISDGSKFMRERRPLDSCDQVNIPQKAISRVRFHGAITIVYSAYMRNWTGLP